MNTDPVQCILKYSGMWEERGGRDGSREEIAGYASSDFADRAEMVREKLAPLADGWFLDAGSGPGALTIPLAPSFAVTVALDLAVSNLKRLHSDDGTVLCVQGSVHSLPFASDTFDRVLCYGVLHCFPSWSVAEQVIRELVRVCRPGGRILIGDNEPLVNNAFDPPTVKQPVNAAEYDPEVTYLCFEPSFFERIFASLGCECVVENSGFNGMFDVIATVGPKPRSKPQALSMNSAGLAPSPDLLTILACPDCQDRPGVVTRDGSVVCPRCGRAYRVENGIPAMPPMEMSAPRVPRTEIDVDCRSDIR